MEKTTTLSEIKDKTRKVRPARKETTIVHVVPPSHVNREEANHEIPLRVSSDSRSPERGNISAYHCLSIEPKNNSETLKV